MRKLAVIVIGAAALVMAFAAPSGAGQSRGDLKDELDALVAAERAFSRMAADKGIRAAFLRYLAVQAVVFRPKPVDGRAWYAERADLDGALSWEPEFAEVSRAGDLGYTTGPWEFRPKPGDKEPAACGHYVSLWRKQPDGSWLVVVDVGNTHAKHDRPVSAGREVTARGEGPLASKEELAAVDTVAAKAAMMNADRAFSNLSMFKGAVEAYVSYAADDIRLYRRDGLPAQGREAMRAVLPDRPARLTWRPTAGSMSAAGDLGFTYGIAELKAEAGQVTGEEFSYLRIWRKQAEGDWKVALDLHDPIPQPAAGRPGG